MPKLLPLELVLYALVLTPILAAASEASVPRIPTFTQLAQEYDYDSDQPFEELVVSEEEAEGGILRSVTIRGADGEPVLIRLAIPDGAGPFPVLLGWTAPYQDRLVAAGVLGAGVNHRLEPDRGHEGLANDNVAQPGMRLWALRGTILDYRRTLDYLLATHPADPQRLAFAGASKGGIMGAVLGGIDERVGAFVLRACGADFAVITRDTEHVRMARVREQAWYSAEFYAQFMASVDPKHFVAKISPRRILFQFGKKDTAVPNSSSQIMVDLAGEPKEVIWYDAGHGLIDAGERPIDDSWKWLCKFWGI